MSVIEEIRDHQARCAAPLVSLRILARAEAREPVPRWVATQVAYATRAVLAEAEAAAHGASAAADAWSSHPGGRTFLQVRVDRLAAAGDDAIAAAAAGDSAMMSRHLRRFDALTAAIWTVQDAVSEPHRVSRTRQEPLCIISRPGTS